MVPKSLVALSCKVKKVFGGGEHSLLIKAAVGRHVFKVRASAFLPGNVDVVSKPAHEVLMSTLLGWGKQFEHW